MTSDRNEEELTAIQIKQLSKQAFQEACQSEDIRRDLAQNFRMSSKPLQVNENVFYWQEDKSKIRPDRSKGRKVTRKSHFFGRSNDLGTRLIKVNVTKVRKDETTPPGKNPCHLHQLLSRQPPNALLETRLPSLQHQDKRKCYIPMVEFVASIARYQLKHRRYLTIENPQTSKIWYAHCTQQLFSDPSVTWGDFHFCAYGLKDPESGLRSLKPTSLMRCLPPKVTRPIFRKCKNFTSSVKKQHQPLEGNAGTFGSRTKLAQVYPYQLCQDFARIILRHLKVKPLDNEVYLLENIFEPFTTQQFDLLRKEMEAIDKEFNMTSSSDAVKIQDLPFNKNVQPLASKIRQSKSFRRP